MKTSTKLRLSAGSLAVGLALAATPSFAQDELGGNEAEETEGQTIIVTGSRIARPNLEAASPVAVVTGDATTEFADVTLDTFLNTLPQVNPAGTTTSNNPGNGGQSNVNLRGLGSNRNLVLVDGRRAMVSASNLTVDLNTIPAALIERIDVITGGAGAVYGADAIAGAVNIILKDDFEGIDVRFNYANALRDWDAEEYSVSGVLGGNFADGRGNAVVAFDYSDREQLIKAQRGFSVFATSTTSFLPDGAIFDAGNPFSQQAVDDLFATYGVAAGSVPTGANLLGVNPDGTLFSKGVFNSPIDVQNFTGPIDFSVNQALFPDLYSYNFDEVNLLVLPLERTSVMSKIDYEFSPAFNVFASGGYTRYKSATALAPTPIPTVGVNAIGENTSIEVASPFITPGSVCGSAGTSLCTADFQLVIPVTNPFIPQDLATLLASRTGDNPALVGSGADEPFLMRQRTLDIGLRQSNRTNEVFQIQAGMNGEIEPGWNYEFSYSFGRTSIDQLQAGNVNTQRLFDLLNAPDGGASQCAGGFNPFGRQPISAECVDFLEATALLRNTFTRKIAQGYITGEIAELPAGTVQMVLGAESRKFKYELDPGVAGGPVSGFNTQNPDLGTNEFFDIFGEVFIPLVSGADWADRLELTLGYRTSRSKFNNLITGNSAEPRWDDAYKAELIWSPNSDINVRASYQRSVRSPNFGELFSGGGSAPQIFDPCSVTSEFRQGGGQGATDICSNAGAFGGITAVDTFVQSPGAQASLTLAGNEELSPETADTFTVGTSFTNFFGLVPGLSGSIDYYNIDISDTIQVPDSNTVIADCYNFYGNNANLDPNYGPCSQLVRFGGDILAVFGPEGSTYPGVNGGKLKTSGIDLQLAYTFAPGFTSDDSLSFNLLMNYLIDFKQQVLPEQPVIDYAGTASFFGAGLGTSFPEWKAYMDMNYRTGPIGWQVRARYIDSMANRASKIFPGETEFTGPGSTIYVDTAVSFELTDNFTLRAGVNNVFDRDPETYAPNVQSGTDPSLYDVIGRRVFGSVQVRF